MASWSGGRSDARGLGLGFRGGLLRCGPRRRRDQAEAEGVGCRHLQQSAAGQVVGGVLVGDHGEQGGREVGPVGRPGVEPPGCSRRRGVDRLPQIGDGRPQVIAPALSDGLGGIEERGQRGVVGERQLIEGPDQPVRLAQGRDLGGVVLLARRLQRLGPGRCGRRRSPRAAWRTARPTRPRGRSTRPSPSSLPNLRRIHHRSVVPATHVRGDGRQKARRSRAAASMSATCGRIASSSVGS